MKFECPLDITAHYLKYPPAFVAWLKERGYTGISDGYHAKIFYQLRTVGFDIAAWRVKYG